MELASPRHIAEYTARGWWGELTLWDVFERQRVRHPDREAVADAPNRADFAPGAPRRLSWRALGDEVQRLCQLLLDRGLGRDDILVMHLPNVVEQFVVYLACARLGIIVTPVPVQYREHELAHILQITRACAVVTMGHIGQPQSGHAAAAMYLALRRSHPHLKQVLAWGASLPEG